MTGRFVSAKRLIRYFSNSSKLVEHRAQSPVREIKMLAVWPSIAEGRDFNKRSHYGSLFFCSVIFGVLAFLFLLWGLFVLFSSMLLFSFYFVLVFVNVHGFLRRSKWMSFLNKITVYLYN